MRIGLAVLFFTAAGIAVWTGLPGDQPTAGAERNQAIDAALQSTLAVQMEQRLSILNRLHRAVQDYRMSDGGIGVVFSDAAVTRPGPGGSQIPVVRDDTMPMVEDGVIVPYRRFLRWLAEPGDAPVGVADIDPDEADSSAPIAPLWVVDRTDASPAAIPSPSEGEGANGETVAGEGGAVELPSALLAIVAYRDPAPSLPGQVAPSLSQPWAVGMIRLPVSAAELLAAAELVMPAEDRGGWQLRWVPSHAGLDGPARMWRVVRPETLREAEDAGSPLVMTLIAIGCAAIGAIALFGGRWRSGNEADAAAAGSGRAGTDSYESTNGGPRTTSIRAASPGTGSDPSRGRIPAVRNPSRRQPVRGSAEETLSREGDFDALAYLAKVGHDLGNLANGVALAADLLDREAVGPLQDPQRDLVMSIRDAGRTMNRLVDDVMDHARLGHATATLRTSDVSIATLVAACLRLIEPTARSKRITVTPPDPEKLARIGTVTADELRMTQVLVNLLGNAVKYTPEDRSIGIEVEPASPDADHVTFVVWDTGIGMDPENISRIFESFVQLDPRTEIRERGVGIGLALVRRIVQLHDGEVTVESEINNGSRFRVAIPGYQPALAD